MTPTLLKNWVEVTNCPLCDSAKSDATTNVCIPGTEMAAMSVGDLEFPVAFGIVYNECPWCGMIYQNPTLNDEGLAEFYKQDGMYRELTKTKTDYAVEEARAARLIGAIKDMEVESVLDIGCGHGELLKLCQDEGMEVQGVDFTSEHCIDGIPACDTLDELDGNKYDLVVMLHLLEHVPDPVAELKLAASYANKYVFVEVPKYDLGDYTVRYLNLPHVLIFRTWTLVNAFERAGIKPSGLATFGRNIIVLGEL